MHLKFDSQVGQGNSQAEFYVQLALDAISSHIAILDDDGEIISVNAAWRDFAGDISFDHADSGVGLRYLAFCDRAEMYRPTHALQVASGISDVIAGKRDSFHLEYPCNIFRNQYWYLLSASRLVLQRHDRIMVMHQDITELKFAQLELEAFRKQIQSVLDQVNSGVFTVSSVGVVKSCNLAGERIFGYSRDELLGMHVTQLVGLSACSADDFRDSDGGKSLTMPGKRRDGSEFTMLVRVKQVSVEDRQWFTVVVEDLSEGRRSESESTEAQRMESLLQQETELQQSKYRFLAMMSHELRTPLASIRLSHDMLTQYDTRSSQDERRLYLDNIRLQVDHVSDILGDVMNLTAPGTHAQDFVSRRGDLITTCRDIVESFHINHHHSHCIEFACPDAEIFAEFDERLLRRALSNLLDNAIKYSPNGGCVKLELWRDQKHARILVSDDGIGVPPQDADTLFDAFRRASNVGTLPGTGLGLAITKQAIEQHGGKIALLQPGNDGATFSIALPLKSQADIPQD